VARARRRPRCRRREHLQPGPARQSGCEVATHFRRATGRRGPGVGIVQKRASGQRAVAGAVITDPKSSTTRRAPSGFQVFERAARLSAARVSDRIGFSFPFFASATTSFSSRGCRRTSRRCRWRLRDRRKRMGEFHAIEADQHVAPALRSAAMPRRLLRGCRRSRMPPATACSFCTVPAIAYRAWSWRRRWRCGEFCLVDVARR